VRLSYEQLAQSCALGIFHAFLGLYAPEHTLDHPGRRH
jgi:hypothetical protein